MMRIYFFIFALLFSFSLVAQATKSEKTENKKTRVNNTNATPEQYNEPELELDEAPTGSAFSNLQSSVISNASLNIKQTLDEINKMSQQKTPTSKQVQKLNYELVKIKNANPNAFEYYLYNYKIGNYDFERIEDLKMAAKLQPNHPEVVKSLSAFFYIQGDTELLMQQLSKMNTGKHFSSELSSFAEDVLKSMPAKAILITHGEDDTYPLLIEQFINKTRQDVKIISLDHLQSEDYRNKLKKEGVDLPAGQNINTLFFEQLVSKNSEKVIVATSLPKSYLNTISNSISVEGLGFKISSNLNTTSHQKKLVSIYDEHINEALNQKIASSGNNKLLSNYLPFLFEIRNYWISKDNKNKLEQIDSQILSIGRQTNKLDQILQILK
jgi:hypothetical protein